MTHAPRTRPTPTPTQSLAIMRSPRDGDGVNSTFGEFVREVRSVGTNYDVEVTEVSATIVLIDPDGNRTDDELMIVLPDGTAYWLAIKA